MAPYQIMDALISAIEDPQLPASATYSYDVWDNLYAAMNALKGGWGDHPTHPGRIWQHALARHPMLMQAAFQRPPSQGWADTSASGHGIWDALLFTSSISQSRIVTPSTHVERCVSEVLPHAPFSLAGEYQERGALWAPIDEHWFRLLLPRTENAVAWLGQDPETGAVRALMEAMVGPNPSLGYCRVCHQAFCRLAGLSHFLQNHSKTLSPHLQALVWVAEQCMERFSKNQAKSRFQWQAPIAWVAPALAQGTPVNVSGQDNVRPPVGPTLEREWVVVWSQALEAHDEHPQKTPTDNDSPPSPAEPWLRTFIRQAHLEHHLSSSSARAHKARL